MASYQQWAMSTAFGLLQWWACHTRSELSAAGHESLDTSRCPFMHAFMTVVNQIFLFAQAFVESSVGTLLTHGD